MIVVALRLPTQLRLALWGALLLRSGLRRPPTGEDLALADQCPKIWGRHRQRERESCRLHLETGIETGEREKETGGICHLLQEEDMEVLIGEEAVRLEEEVKGIEEIGKGIVRGMKTEERLLFLGLARTSWANCPHHLPLTVCRNTSIGVNLLIISVFRSCVQNRRSYASVSKCQYSKYRRSSTPTISSTGCAIPNLLIDVCCSFIHFLFLVCVGRPPPDYGPYQGPGGGRGGRRY